MFYTVYKTTNKITNKIYIGKHQTKDLNDGYIGSGKRLWNSICKYGIENFEKEILFVFETEAEMNAKEKQLVTEEFCLREDTYNLCPGGKGGWGYVNSNLPNGMEGKSQTQKQKTIAATTIQKNFEKILNDKESYQNWLNKLKERPPTRGTTGKKYSEETKKKMSESKKGSHNSQFGTMWITNGNDNRKIKKEDLIPEGWYKGRK